MVSVPLYFLSIQGKASSHPSPLTVPLSAEEKIFPVFTKQPGGFFPFGLAEKLSAQVPQTAAIPRKEASFRGIAFSSGGNLIGYSVIFTRYSLRPSS